MARIRKVGRWLSVLGVLVVAVVAGVFLAACRRVSEPGRKPDARKRPSSAPAATTTAPAATSRPAKTTVDVKETERGQPVPRNLLE